jgi:hypothetical protein
MTHTDEVVEKYAAEAYTFYLTEPVVVAFSCIIGLRSWFIRV